ncbi:UvrD-helicase domain-containing protein [Truepera radiovictrix]|uniref:DNA 3'-5' helicase n=1 Tax=Truepera radiovictrix (strain DSM 17093 / CIP 108686 / LMG 22925 / RQ-24) TaxID=649638 RepID=D7CX66_TRURR|nr:UvrD-helicase domain-containing protein [Truepera radiovictrix]ADI13190.1 UvrD/REP helicase [Truepera radiovictrix DSM 17093]WMT58241.1 UvrD-helicase domain-containing protein [Truepera radiovictrix]
MPETVSDHPLLAVLNEEQRAAAEHFQGPALVLAGAGSGKTRTVVHRIAYLMDAHEVYPTEILAVTFTNKAAGELKERVAHLMGEAAKDLWVSTFHSACLRILRAYGGLIGLEPGFAIYDDTDQLEVLKEILERVTGLGDANPRVLRALIDRAKSNLWTPAELAREGERVFGGMVAGLPLELVAEVYERYSSRLRSVNAVDFNDILGRTVELFERFPEVLEKVQQRAVFIHVDEYQDTNTAQYRLTRLLANKYANLMVVGDPDQCLPPETRIPTRRGCLPIACVQEGDEVLGTGGGLQPTWGHVTTVKRGRYRGPMWEVRVGGRVVRGTPHHLVLARLDPEAGFYYVYLMYREDRGYRLGLTKSLRANDFGQDEVGFRVRLAQENGDKLWVLRVCQTYAEARYWEARFAAEYGLPTLVFHGVGRRLKMDEGWIARLYQDVDTTASAARLMAQLHLHPDFPHYRPQNGLRRQSVNLVMFQDFRHGGVGYHRVQWSSIRADLAARLLAAGYPVRSNGRGGYRTEICRKSYRDALAFARGFAEAGGLELQRKAYIDGRMYHVTPLAHLHPGMRVLVKREQSLEEAVVETVSQVAYDGPVFDLEVTPTHTYLANGMLVHNSIYAFRGADVRNILDFREDFPDAAVYRLELNYRSVASVLELANAVIAPNEGRLEKRLRPVKGAGDKVRLYRAADHRAEADFVARQIERLQAERGLSAKDFTVLYRTNSQSRVLEEALRRAGIPAKIVGGVGFYERREVKDILSYARAALNPADDVAWRRVLNRPKRGIGKTSEETLVAFAAKRGIRFSEALRRAEEPLRGTPALKRIGEFVALMDDLREAAETLPAAQFLQAAIDQSGYLQALKDEKSFEAQGRIENLDELVNAVAEWQEETGGSIGEFLDEAALLASVDDRAVKAVNQGQAPEEAVTLMTLHNAKGLEFPVVFLVGLEENLIPHRSSLASLQEIEEERRLLYVGVTRAQELLFLVHCESRMSFGRTEFARPSRFLEDIPKGMLQEIDVFGQELHAERLSKYSRAVWAPPKLGATGASAPASAEDGGGVSFRGGERVKHPKFGLGTVVGVSGEGARAEVTVVFQEAGPKRLLFKYANLTRA